MEQKKKMEAEQNIQNNGRAEENKSHVMNDMAAVLGGAALAHEMGKHHRHDDAKGITDENVNLWDAQDEELYDAGMEDASYDDGGIQDNDYFMDDDTDFDVIDEDDFMDDDL